jgi:2-polyprenyl-3-methyl-5-hydroxy-6-metoxy-1,4-benzoquinol methylase
MKQDTPQTVWEETIYAKRFSAAEQKTRAATWRILCREFLQQFIDRDATVLDVGSGDGLFLHNIEAARKIALDGNPGVAGAYGSDVQFVQGSATELTERVREPVHVIFMSNFLEHLPNKYLVLEVLQQCRQLLLPGGRLIILQPNIRYTGPAYWDYLDHHIALTEHSLCEAVSSAELQVEKLIPRFLPYTAKSSLGRAVGGGGSRLVSWYLRLPFLWRIFGQQTLLIARK